MAKLNPPEKKTQKKQEASAIDGAKPVAAIEQTPPSSLVLMQIRVPETARNEFKAYASMRSKSMNILFLEMFEEFKENNKAQI